jgi:hypothetical protein
VALLLGAREILRGEGFPFGGKLRTMRTRRECGLSLVEQCCPGVEGRRGLGGFSSRSVSQKRGSWVDDAVLSVYC